MTGLAEVRATATNLPYVVVLPLVAVFASCSTVSHRGDPEPPRCCNGMVLALKSSGSVALLIVVGNHGLAGDAPVHGRAGIWLGACPSTSTATRLRRRPGADKPT